MVVADFWVVVADCGWFWVIVGDSTVWYNPKIITMNSIIIKCELSSDRLEMNTKL